MTVCKCVQLTGVGISPSTCILLVPDDPPVEGLPIGPAADIGGWWPFMMFWAVGLVWCLWVEIVHLGIVVICCNRWFQNIVNGHADWGKGKGGGWSY